MMKKTSSVLKRYGEQVRMDMNIKNYFKKKSKETTHKQQILILHYMGILDKYKLSGVKKGILFSKLINKNDKNTEDYIRNVVAGVNQNNLKTEENLEFVYNLFEESGLLNEAAEVKMDLFKLKKE